MRRYIALLVVAALAVGVTAPATATPGTASHHAKVSPFSARYLHLYWGVVRRFDRRTPGRNIVTRGVRTDRGVRDARLGEIARSIRQLRQLLHPAPALLVRTARPPTLAPAGVASAGVAVGSGHMACIISKESGGNPRAENGQYHGIGQWSPSSWAHYGGTRYATDPVNATYEQQLVVLASEGDAGMSNQQGQYDGCG